MLSPCASCLVTVSVFCAYYIYVYFVLISRFGEKVLTNGWGGHVVPSGSFTSDTYLWIRFTTNVGNADARFHKGWTGIYQKYWPYVNGKKKRK